MKKEFLFCLLCSLPSLPCLAAINTPPPAITKNMNGSKATAWRASSEFAMPEGFVMIEDFVPGDFKQLPIDLIQTAESEFSARNLGESAASLRAAGKVFRLQAKQASSAESRDQIYAAARELDQLADDVKNQAIKSIEIMRNKAAKALYRNAVHHRLQAAREWQLGRSRRAGDEIRAAAMASEQAAQWADKELYQSQRESLDRARELAFHLSRNMGWTAADMSDVLRRLEQVSKGIASRVMKPAEGSRATESPAGL